MLLLDLIMTYPFPMRVRASSALSCCSEWLWTCGVSHSRRVYLWTDTLAVAGILSRRV